MSAASYKRGSEKIRRDIEAETPHFPTVPEAWHQAIAEAQAEATNLRVQLDHERAEHAAQLAAKEQELEASRALVQKYIDAAEWSAKLRRETEEAYRQRTAKWEKLSQIIRDNVPPTRWHEWNEDFDRMYPWHPGASRPAESSTAVESDD